MVVGLLVRCREAGSRLLKKHTYLLSFWSGEILFWSDKNILVMDITFWTQKSQGMLQLVTNCFSTTKPSVVPRSDNDFCTSMFTIMLNDSVLLRL